MWCKSKFDNSDKHIYECEFNDDKVKLTQENFHITITKYMFDKLFEIIKI